MTNLLNIISEMLSTLVFAQSHDLTGNNRNAGRFDSESQDY